MCVQTGGFGEAAPHKWQLTAPGQMRSPREQQRGDPERTLGNTNPSWTNRAWVAGRDAEEQGSYPEGERNLERSLQTTDNGKGGGGKKVGTVRQSRARNRLRMKGGLEGGMKTLTLRSPAVRAERQRRNTANRKGEATGPWWVAEEAHTGRAADPCRKQAGPEQGTCLWLLKKRARMVVSSQVRRGPWGLAGVKGDGSSRPVSTE